MWNVLLECQYSGVHLGPDGEDGRRLPGVPARQAVRARQAEGRKRGSMKDLPDNELIKLYIKAVANESGDLPFGAKARGMKQEAPIRALDRIKLQSKTLLQLTRRSDADCHDVADLWSGTFGGWKGLYRWITYHKV